jgi:hypothetical protein
MVDQRLLAHPLVGLPQIDAGFLRATLRLFVGRSRRHILGGR